MLQHEEADAATHSFEVIPAIDLMGGQVVRLAQGDFERRTVYSTDPAAVAKGFVASGARWIHVVDLDGAREGARRQANAVSAVVDAAAGHARCEVAGGLRDETAVATVLATGAARVVVGTAALRDPDLVARLVTQFGAERVAVALDVRDGVAIGQGWVQGFAGLPVEAVLEAFSDRGARIFEVTAIERDGLLRGPNLDLLGSIVALGRGAVIASAGISSVADLEAVRALGCSGAIIGRAVYEGRLSLAEAASRFG